MVLAPGKYLCASSVFNPPETPLKVSIALPAESLQADDLDARDEFNRPVRTVKIQRAFEQIWISNLNRMLMNSLTPTRLLVLALLNSRWDGFTGAIRSTTEHVRRWVTLWFSAKKPQVRFLRFSQPLVLFFDSGRRASPSTENVFQSFLSSLISSTRLLR